MHSGNGSQTRPSRPSRRRPGISSATQRRPTASTSGRATTVSAKRSRSMTMAPRRSRSTMGRFVFADHVTRSGPWVEFRRARAGWVRMVSAAARFRHGDRTPRVQRDRGKACALALHWAMSRGGTAKHSLSRATRSHGMSTRGDGTVSQIWIARHGQAGHWSGTYKTFDGPAGEGLEHPLDAVQFDGNTLAFSWVDDSNASVEITGTTSGRLFTGSVTGAPDPAIGAVSGIRAAVTAYGVATRSGSRCLAGARAESDREPHDEWQSRSKCALHDGRRASRLRRSWVMHRRIAMIR